MTTGRKDHGDNLSHEDRVKGGEHSHAGRHDESHQKQDQQGNKPGRELTDEERSHGDKNS